ncbi:MAG: hypothetical protein AAGC55_23585, partial [Myxococcota bacterium]
MSKPSPLSELWNSRPLRKLRRDRLAMVCLLIIGMYAVIAALVSAGVIATGYAVRVGENYMAPSFERVELWLGTDRQGRSILIRTLYSAKIAFQVGLVTALFGVIFGAILGGIAGYFGRFIDDAIVYLYSTVQSIPYLLL